MKKKLIFVTRALWIGGIESALVNLLNALDYEKFDATCLVLRASLEIAGRITPQCRLVAADREKTVTFGKPYLFSRLYHLTEECGTPSRLHRCFLWAVPGIKWVENRLYIRYIRKHFKNQRYDTCIIYSDTAAETAVRAVKADRYLLFYHHGSLRRVYHDEIGCKRAEKIITVSEPALEKLKAFRPAYARKMLAVPNLADAPRVRELAREAPETVFPEGQFHLVTCGRLAEEKGIDLAVRACRLLLDRGYADLHWWIIGGGPEEERLKALVAEQELADHVHLLGMQDNPYPCMAAADLYVQPSRFENHCMGILEARILCLPILATKAAGNGQIRSGENGMLCEGTPESIAGAVEYLRLHGEEREKYIRFARENSPEGENGKHLKTLERLFAGEENG